MRSNPSAAAARAARHQSGRIALELATVLLIAGSAWAYLRAIPASHSIIRGEAAAVSTLRSIAAEQRRRIEAGSPPAFLSELPARLFDDDADDGDRRTIGRASLAHRGYRYVVYLAGADGQALLEPGSVAPHPTFWIAYAWPDAWGHEGRSVFAVDPSGTVRRYDNAHGVFEGRAELPPAWFAPEPEGVRYPIERGPLGFLEEAKWRVLDGHAP